MIEEFSYGGFYRIIIDVDPNEKDLMYVIEKITEDLDWMRKQKAISEYAVSVSVLTMGNREITLKTAFEGEHKDG